MATVRSKSRRASQQQPPLNGLRLTHPERVLYAEQNITKRDLANYYATVADWILPHLAGRPIVLVRCPEGMKGPCFYQKHPPQGLSESVERIQIQEKSEIDTYLVVRDLPGLISLVQFGALELHVWGARADDVERPDRIVFDLDPDPAVPWKRVIDAAILLRHLLEQLDLTSFVKTTGGKGLHVVVPVARRHTWSEITKFAKSIADKLANEAPDRFVANMSKAARKGKIFVDYLRNQRGATAVAAYSSRAKRGATVSFPLDWNELPKLTDPAQFTVENAPERLARRKRDPWQELAKTKQSITAAVKRKLNIR